ncbi:MAG: hypothetical protein DCF29_09840 [Alphaproteobacteria bacterium]|nr:MAG: hypothetical protein DCF29_09840 [Alphaproteobacteria bacterium]
MIEIEAVQPTAREFRSIRRGWGLIHWVCLLPTHAFLIGFVLFGVVALAVSDNTQAHGLFSVFLIGSWLLSLIGGSVVRRVVAREMRRSPAGNLPWRWLIDERGLEFDNGLQCNRVDWRAVKAFQEEKDRFLFLVTPAYNPVLPTRLLTDEQKQALRALVADVRARGVLGAGVD